MRFFSIKIPTDIHAKLKKYCKENALKLNAFVAIIITKEIDNARKGNKRKN